jgi:hypothetical protein
MVLLWWHYVPVLVALWSCFGGNMVLLGWHYGPVMVALWSCYGSVYGYVTNCAISCRYIYLYILVGGNVFLMLCPVIFGNNKLSV